MTVEMLILRLAMYPQKMEVVAFADETDYSPEKDYPINEIYVRTMDSDGFYPGLDGKLVVHLDLPSES